MKFRVYKGFMFHFMCKALAHVEAVTVIMRESQTMTKELDMYIQGPARMWAMCSLLSQLSR